MAPAVISIAATVEADPSRRIQRQPPSKNLALWINFELQISGRQP
jgi:hypothetical protein